MVYAMNLGLATADGRAMLSHMRFEPRRKESLTAAEWFTGHGFALGRPGSDGVGPHFESGDAFVFGDSLVVGYGPRTEAEALKHLATEWNIRVRGLRIAHEGMYHLDLPFCPVDSTHAMVYPPAFDAASQAELFGIVPDPIVLTDDEAFAFSANSIVVERDDHHAGLLPPPARHPHRPGPARRRPRPHRVPQGRRLRPLPHQPPGLPPPPHHHPRRRPSSCRPERAGFTSPPVLPLRVYRRKADRPVGYPQPTGAGVSWWWCR